MVVCLVVSMGSEEEKGKNLIFFSHQTALLTNQQYRQQLGHKGKAGKCLPMSRKKPAYDHLSDRLLRLSRSGRSSPYHKVAVCIRPLWLKIDISISLAKFSYFSANWPKLRFMHKETKESAFRDI